MELQVSVHCCARDFNGRSHHFFFLFHLGDLATWLLYHLYVCNNNFLKVMVKFLNVPCLKKYVASCFNFYLLSGKFILCWCLLHYCLSIV